MLLLLVSPRMHISRQTLASFPGAKRFSGNHSLFAEIQMTFPIILGESVKNGTFLPRKGICCRMHVVKWAAWQQQLRNSRCMQIGYCCACAVVQVYRCIYSLPFAFTSRGDTTSWLALISRHAPCNKLFFATKVPFSTDSPRITGNIIVLQQKAGIAQRYFTTREGRSTGRSAVN